MRSDHVGTGGDMEERGELITVAEGAAGPYDIVHGPDGALWLTLVHTGELARLATDHHVDRYALGAPTCGPTILTPGPDGALWCARTWDHTIGRIAVGAGAEHGAGAEERGSSVVFALPTPECGPYGIAAGADGALWFTEMNMDRIGRITTEGEVTEFPLPLSGAFPSGIAAGPDGALWFTLNQADAVGRIDLEGRVTVHQLPTRGAAPVHIACAAAPGGGPSSRGPAGHVDGGVGSAGGELWFAEIGAGQIGRISVDGHVEEFPLPDRACKPHAVAVAPDGVCWFTEWGTSRIGCLAPDGHITEHSLPAPGREPHGLALGPDGAVYVALETGEVARVSTLAS